jgi:hypothetical protein
MPIDGFTNRNTMLEQAMPMTAPGVSNSVFDFGMMATTDIDRVDVKNIGGNSNLSVGFGGGLMNLAGGSSFMIGTALIGVIAFVIYLIQQLRRRKK